MFARFRRDASGASALEFAMVAPVFFIMVFAIVQLGWAYHCAGSVQYALERASRTVMLQPNITETNVRNAMDDFLTDVSNDQFGVTLVDETINGASFARITTTYQHVVRIPFVEPFTLNFSSVQVGPRPDMTGAD